MRDKLSKGDTDGALEVFVTYVNGPNAWKSTPEATKQSLRDNAWTFPAADKDEVRWPPFSCDDAKRLTMPVLLLAGDRSPANFGQVLDKVQPCLQRAQRGVISNSSHAMPRMNPGGFNTAVLTFIEAH
jgi:pimeloyl-ACP methyl ester carboxylesterase